MQMSFLDNEVSRLLGTYDNLWIDLSWSILDEYLLTNDKDNVRSHWLAIIEQYPERFVIGSDLVGSFDRIGEKMADFDVLLDELGETEAAMVARENLLRVLKGPAAPP